MKIKTSAGCCVQQVAWCKRFHISGCCCLFALTLCLENVHSWGPGGVRNYAGRGLNARCRSRNHFWRMQTRSRWLNVKNVLASRTKANVFTVTDHVETSFFRLKGCSGLLGQVQAFKKLKTKKSKCNYFELTFSVAFPWSLSEPDCETQEATSGGWGMKLFLTFNVLLAMC